MARYKRSKHRSYTKSITFPIAPLAGLGVGIAPAIPDLLSGNYKNALDGLAWRYAGYNLSTGQMDINGLKYGLLPLIGGALVHKFVGGKPIGLNAMLARAGVPFIRI